MAVAEHLSLVMGVKKGKRKGGGTDRLGDKRARVEAGLDLEVGDLADTVLEQVVREVAAPAAK